MSLAKNPLRSNAIRSLSAAALVAVAASLLGCPPGMCLVRVNGQCAVDTCPEHAALNESTHACGCKEGFVAFNGACMLLDDANQQCGAGNQYANGGCVAIACPQGQIMNAASGHCESRAQSDALVAKAEGKELKAGQSIGCPGGFTYVFNGAEGACVPNDAVCGVGTRYEGGKCTAISCPPGQVFDLQQNGCAKLATGGDQQTYSVALKLKSAMGPDFCSPHAKNPGGFGVSPGQTKTDRRRRQRPPRLVLGHRRHPEAGQRPGAGRHQGARWQVDRAERVGHGRLQDHPRSGAGHLDAGRRRLIGSRPLDHCQSDSAVAGLVRGGAVFCCGPRVA
jgi:hypothetical protein